MQKKNESFLFVMTLLTLFTTSCATVGKNFDFDTEKKIKIGISTQADVIKELGEPFRSGYNNGDLVWTYGYYKYRLLGQTDAKDLQVYFDKHGVVTDYAYSTSNLNEKERIQLSRQELDE